MRSYQLDSFIIEIEQEIRKNAFLDGLYYEDKYLRVHNNTCPLCNKKIKLGFRKKLSRVGIVGTILFEKKSMYISYALCMHCTDNVMNGSSSDKKKYESVITKSIINKV